MSESGHGPFTIEIAVRWGDMDALGHVNNAVYFTYLEQARIAWFESMGLAGGLLGESQGPLIVNASCTYHRPIVYPARIRVSVAAGEPGRSSFDTVYEIRDAAEVEILYLTASSRVVWVDHADGRSIPIPDDLRTRLPAAASS
jgi:acyl-CoA thioester hydrolase